MGIKSLLQLCVPAQVTCAEHNGRREVFEELQDGEDGIECADCREMFTESWIIKIDGYFICRTCVSSGPY